MKVITTISEWRGIRAGPEFAGRTVGFVPTMGALHAGHRALLERARAENDCVVLSIFVNPTQFNDATDLARYPRTLAADVALAEGLVDAVLSPDAADLYPDRYRYRVTEGDLSKQWEGAHRPGHFDGVLTVVCKLLNLVRPDRAYFGEKDWQQLQLVRDMAAALFLPGEIVACPTVRASDGLALSSRNARLSAVGRAQAPAFSRLMRASATAEDAAQALQAAGFEVDYVADHAGVRLGAVRLEGVRLIDNVRL
jgi:pantoate--beta-alanine ligase